MEPKKEPGLAFAGEAGLILGLKREAHRYCELSSRSLFSPMMICCSSSV
jgi:hypothetical protein